MKPLLALLLVSIPLSAAITNARATGTTPINAILQYTTTDGVVCTHEISESATYLPLAFDVDPALFTNANRDDRNGAQTGLNRIFVFGGAGTGIRYAPVALNGLRVSRAAATDTVYYVRTTCGASQSAYTLRTGNIGLGVTTNEGVPADPGGSGAAAWPDLSWSDRTKEVIDPQTGVKIHRVTFPSMAHFNNEGPVISFAHAYGSAWTSPAAAYAATGAGASYSGAGRDPLVLTWDYAPGVPTGSSIVIDGFNALFVGYGAAAAGADRTISVCITIDGSTCYGTTQTLVLPQNAAGAEQWIGDDLVNINPAPTTPDIFPSWRAATQAPPSNLQVKARSGSVNTNGTAVDFRANSGMTFGDDIQAGGHMVINAVDYVIASVQNAFHVTLTGSAGVQTNVPYILPNFGIIVKKTSASVDQINVRARSSLSLGAYGPLNGSSGNTQMCALRLTPEGVVVTAATNANPIVITTSPASGVGNGATITVAGVAGNTAANGTFTATTIDATHFSIPATGNGAFTTSGIAYLPNAKMGYHCGLGASGSAIFWIAPSDGEVRWLGPAYVFASGGAHPSGFGSSINLWDASDPVFDGFYIGMDKILITGNPTVGYNKDVGVLGDASGIGDAGVQAGWRRVNDTISSPGLITEATAFDAVANGGFGIFGVNATMTPAALSPQGLQNGYLVVAANLGYQDTLAWWGAYDTTNHVMVALTNSWSALPDRWCTSHGVSITPTAPGVNNVWLRYGVHNPNGGAGNYSGPYDTFLTTALTTTTAGCATLSPGNVLQLTDASTCSAVTVTQEPTSPANVTPANQQLQLAAPGDVFYITPYANPPVETVRLVSKSGLTWIVQRGFDKLNSIYNHAIGDTMRVVCAEMDFQHLYNQAGQNGASWDFVRDPHGNNPGDPYLLYNMASTSADPGDPGVLHTTRALELYLTGVNHPGFRGPLIVGGGANNRFPFTDTDPLAGGYSLRNHSWPGHPFDPKTWVQVSNGPFAGATGYDVGEGVEAHTSLLELINTWFADARPLNPGISDEIVALVGGKTQIYKVTHINNYYDNHGGIQPKRHFLYAYTGRFSLADVSGPGSVLADSGYGKCFAYAANECVTGSLAGELYVSAPRVAGYPVNNSAGMPVGQINQFSKFHSWVDSTDIVTGVLGPDADHLTQVLVAGKEDLWARYSRKLTKGLALNKQLDALANQRPLPDGSWTFFMNNLLGGTRLELLLAKLPAVPGETAIHNEFVPVTQTIKSVPAGTTNVIVEFGYNPSFYCTDRAEVCVANQAAVAPDVTVFSYATTDTYAGLACAAGCTVVIPALPQRVLWYRVKYRDVANALLSTGRTQIVATP